MATIRVKVNTLILRECKMITQEELKELVHYNTVTGDFTWIVSSQRVKVGEKLRSIKKNGVPYYRTRIKGEHHLLHRLAWLYMKGVFPTLQIDHINRNSLDNRWSNLREVTASVNIRNSDRYDASNSSTGIKGLSKVCINKNNYLVASITVDKKNFKKYFKPGEEEKAENWLVANRIRYNLPM